MTLQDLIEQWPGATSDARFASFLSWIDTEVEEILLYLPAFTIVRDDATANVSGTPDTGFQISTGFFTENDPALAIAAGEMIISALFQHANEEWYKKQKENKKLEKEYRKHLNKLWEKLLKDAKLKGDPGYADWYYGYYLPKYYGEYGSP